MAEGFSATEARAQELTPDLPVTPAVQRAYQQPWLARDPVRANHLAISYQEGQQQTCYLATSSDGGSSWSNTPLFGSGGRFPLPAGYNGCRQPQIAYGPDGTLYYLVALLVNNGFGVFGRPFVAVSHDGGATFQAPVLLKQTDVGLSEGIAVDRSTGRAYVTWIDVSCTPPPEMGGTCNFSQERTLTASSTDQGATFSAPKQASAADSTLNGAFAAVDSDGTLYVSWLDHGNWVASGGLRTTPFDLYVSTSSDGGQTFRPPVNVAGVLPGCGFTIPICDDLHAEGVNTVAYQSLASSGGRVFLAWWSYDANGRSRIFLASSTNGAGWSAPRVIGVPAGKDQDQQDRVHLSVGPTGELDVAYYDESPAGFQDTYWMRSTDGGNTFSEPQKLNQQPSDLRIGPPSRFSATRARFGEFLGLDSSGAEVYTAWTDARRGTLDNGKQDVFFAKILFPPPAGVAAPVAPFPVAAVPGTAARPAACGKSTAKMSLLRGTFSGHNRTIDILAPITKFASGNIRVQLHAAGRKSSFPAPVDRTAGRIRVKKQILASQALLGTGILTLRYPGDADTRSQVVRLRAANNPANLTVVRPKITKTGFLVASGTVTKKARGVVRVQLEYIDRTSGDTVTLERAAKINAQGEWHLNAKLSAGIQAQIANRCGTVHSYTLFTGYLPRRIRGEMRSLQVLPSL